jgi:pimeloyl-ACP methyl ester carboxylesterase
MKKVSYILAVLSIVTSCSTNKTQETIEFIEIRGKKQGVRDIGTGDPPVIFITGAGTPLEGFDSVQNAIALSYRTISYDKPGIGKSEMIDEPRTLENMTDHLRQILDSKNINQPVILVGHSIGGMIARYFEINFPHRVAGMVLVDPGYEYMLEEIRSLGRSGPAYNVDSMMKIIIKDTTISIGGRAEIRYREHSDSVLQLAKTTTKIPIVLLESIKVQEEDFITEDIIEIWKRGHKRYQQEQVPHMRIVSTDKSGHFIQLEEPGLVIDAIKQVIKEINKGQ